MYITPMLVPNVSKNSVYMQFQLILVLGLEAIQQKYQNFDAVYPVFVLPDLNLEGMKIY